MYMCIHVHCIYSNERKGLECGVLQASYDAIKKVVKAASEDPVLGKYVGYTEDQVIHTLH